MGFAEWLLSIASPLVSRVFDEKSIVMSDSLFEKNIGLGFFDIESGHGIRVHEFDVYTYFFLSRHILILPCHTEWYSSSVQYTRRVVSIWRGLWRHRWRHHNFPISWQLILRILRRWRHCSGWYFFERGIGFRGFPQHQNVWRWRQLIPVYCSFWLGQNRPFWNRHVSHESPSLCGQLLLENASVNTQVTISVVNVIKFKANIYLQV